MAMRALPAPLLLLLLVAALAVVCHCAADSQHPSSDDRIYKHDLSDYDHDEDEDEDDHKYDHDAFLGKDEAEKYNKMSPDESKENLALLVEKIDGDKDGFVTNQELTDWINKISRRYIVEDSQKQFSELQPVLDGKITWEQYRAKRREEDEDDDDDEEEKASSAKTEARDRRRWEAADADGDGQLNLQEFMDFSHPEESPRLRHIVGQETMEELDSNKDGFVDSSEYIADLWKPSDSEKQEPDWVATERSNFDSEKDKNGDGKLDLTEVTDWIVPRNSNHAATEAQHLIQQADTDKDGQLSKQEILDKHEVFVGSQATDFGEALGKHDEL